MLLGILEEETTFAISEGVVEFDWTAFIREFLYNLLHWIALPYIMYAEGSTGARSRMYWGFDYGYKYVIMFGVMSLGFLSLNIIYFGAFTSEQQNRYLMGIFSVDLFVMSRCCVIGIKWGYQPPAIFEVMRKQVLTTEQVTYIPMNPLFCCMCFLLVVWFFFVLQL